MPPKYTAAEKKAYQAKKLKAVVKVAKAVKVAKKISGRGDYRPTSMNRKIGGRGDYFSDLLGGAGHALGSMAGGALGRIFGSGDYRKEGPRSNSIWKHREVSSAAKDTLSRAGADPSMAPFSMGAMSVQFDEGPPRVTHREFIGPVLSTGDKKFSTKTYRIQPGLRGTDVLFPWGSSVASCFQQYELMGMVLEYRTTSSNFAADSALGTVMLSTLYDANASPLATQQAVDNNDFTTSTVPSASVYHPIECATKESPTTVRYVRTDNSQVNIANDERFDDVGIFQVSQFGVTAPAGSQIGEIWATYDIKFMKAQLPDLHAGTSFLSSGTSESLGDFTSRGPFETFVDNESSSLPVTLSKEPVVDGSRRVNLPIGYNGAYLLVFSASCGTGDIMSTDGNSIQIGSDVTLLALFPNFPNVEASAISNSYVPFQVSGTDANPQTNTYAALFYTIAENAEQNYVDLYPQWVSAATNPTAVPCSILITAVDNDLITAQAGIERQLKSLSRDPRLQKLLLKAAEKPKPPRRNSDAEYVYGTGEMTPIPSGAQSSAAAAATERFASGMLSPFRRAPSNK